MSRIINENESDSKIILKQAVELSDLTDYDNDDVVINNEDDLYGAFYDDLDNEINKINNSEKLKLEYFDDAAEFVKVITLKDLDDEAVTIEIQLTRQMPKQKLSFYFKDFINDVVSELESQKAEFTVEAGVMNAANRYDPNSGREYEEEQEEFDDSDYVYLKTKGEVMISYEKFVGESENRDITQSLFDEFEYESEYSRFFGRGTNEYLHNTYGGNDIKKLDRLIKSELEDNSLSIDDLRSWTPDFINTKIKEARRMVKESYVSEDMKQGITNILNKFKNKISFKYQGNKKNKDGNHYDRFVCKIKKAGIFDLVGFEDELKKLGNKLGIIFKVTYPNSKQDHSLFWVEGRYKNEILNKDGSKFTYESKQLKESEYAAERKKEKADFAYKCYEESKKNGFHKIITLDIQDSYGDIEAMIRYIAGLADPGHSFSIDVDPHDNENKQTFGVDGDGSDRIKIVSVEKLDEESEEGEGE